MALAAGQTLSRYRLVDKIGEGGFGEVWLAEDSHLDDKDVAVKVLKPGMLSDESARRRFRDEAFALAKLDHPNIAMVSDFDTQDGIDFLVMEYVRGITLDRRIRDQPLPERDVVQLGIQLTSGLATAHARGILHRDLKPGNVRITPEGRLKILDFGLAKMIAPSGDATTATLTRGVAGTPAYMAPEQLAGQPAGVRSDVYAAGAVLYEMATGRRAFNDRQRGRSMSIRERVPALSEQLDLVVQKSLAGEPEERYPTADALREDLERVHRGLTPSIGKPLWKRRVPLAATLVTIAATTAVVVWLWLVFRPAEIRSLAVLPLANLSGDPEQEYIADGLTEALITDLGKIAALTVIAQPSVEVYRDTDLPPRQIARRLGIDALVRGSVTPMGDRIRIMVQLIDGRTERQLWSERYERFTSDVLVVQGEVATTIARKIEISVAPEEAQLLASARQVDPDAHRAYLKGRFHVARFTEADLRKATEEFKRAVTIDSTYAEAYASMGFSYFVLGQPFQVSDEEMMPRARDAAEQALTLDDTVAEGHLTLGLINLLRDYDWEGSREALVRAVELNPSYAYAHSMYAFYLSVVGRHEDAILEAQLAEQLDPLSPIIGTYVAEIFLLAGRYADAEAQARKVLDRDGDFPRAHLILLLCYENTARYEQAIAAFEAKESLVDARADDYSGLGRAYQAAGPEGYWRWRYEDLINDVDEAAIKAARAAAMLGNTETALELIEKAFENREGTLPLWIRWNSTFESLRDDPRFQALLRRMNLEPGPGPAHAQKLNPSVNWNERGS